MSLLAYYQWMCDGCGRKLPGVRGPLLQSKMDAEQVRKERRWLSKDGREFCPSCANELEEP